MNSVYQWIVQIAAYGLMPVMYGAFVLGIVIKLLIYVTTRREAWFTQEFEKRVHRFIDHGNTKIEHSFYVVVKTILERTYYEAFSVRSMMKRRRPDLVLGLTDRLFMIQSGCAQVVRDTLRQVQNMKHANSHTPKFLDVSKAVFENNPWFKRIIGVFNASVFNDILNIMPGLFIIAGIFGTFLGIMQALPSLAGMDLADVEGAKKIMDAFLVAMSYAMVKSIIGIMLSVTMTLLNGILAVESIYVSAVNRFENCLALLWNVAANNKIPTEIPQFDEHRDPIDALAAQTVAQELQRIDNRRVS